MITHSVWQVSCEPDTQRKGTAVPLPFESQQQLTMVAVAPGSVGGLFWRSGRDCNITVCFNLRSGTFYWLIWLSTSRLRMNQKRFEHPSCDECCLMQYALTVELLETDARRILLLDCPQMNVRLLGRYALLAM
jgi:hypothetical protein